MATISMRKSLRQVQALRSLSGKEMDVVANHLICKEYKSGDVIWRGKKWVNFIGIIQQGWIFVEYRVNGKLRCTTRLSEGEFLQPRKIKNVDNIFILVRAITDVRLYTLSINQYISLRARKYSPKTQNALLIGKRKYIPWRRIWAMAVAILIIFIIWDDTAKITSGMLYLATTRENQSNANVSGFVKLLDYAEAIDPDANYAYNQEGFIWFQNAELEIANTSFEKALDIDETNSSVLNNLAVSYFTSGRKQQAVRYQKNAAKYDPNSETVLYNLGITLLDQNDTNAAIRAFIEASYIDPVWILPQMQLSSIFIQNQNYDKAEQVANEAIQIDSSHHPAHLALAIALHHQGKNLSALYAIQNAALLAPDNRVTKFYQGLILSGLGEYDAALKVFQPLIKTAPSHWQIHPIMAEIEAINRLRQYSENKIGAR